MKPNMVMVIVLVSLLVVLSLFAVVRYTDLLKPAAPANSAGEEKRIFAEDPKDVKQLTIVPASGKEVSLVHKGGQWRLSKPVDAPADEAVMAGLLNVVKYLRYQKVYQAGDRSVGDSLTGLDQPLWKVAMQDGGGKTYTLLVGQTVPRLGDDRVQTYVRPEGDKRTFVVSENLAEALRRSGNEYRDRTVLKLTPADVVRLRVEGQQSFELGKNADGWSVSQPVSAPADMAKVQSLVDTVAHLQAEEFVDEKVDPASLGLKRGEESLVVRVWLRSSAPAPAPAAASAPASAPATAPAEGPSYEIAFGTTRGDSVYAMRLDQPGVFKVAASVLQSLRVELADVRDRKIFRFGPLSVDRVELTLPGGVAGELGRNRVTGEWLMTRPHAGKANAAAVDKLLVGLESLRVYRFLETPAKPEVTGVDKPRVKVTLHLMGKDKPLELKIGSPALSPDETYVSAGAETVVVRTSDLELAKADLASYWATDILTLPSGGTITELSVQQPTGTAKLTSDEAGAWSLVEPVKARADSNAVSRLTGLLADLNAAGIVATGDKAPSKYADANGIVRVAITVAVEPPPAPASQPASASAPATMPTSSPASAPASKPAVKKIEKTFRLAVVKVDDKVYGWVEGQPLIVVGELPIALWQAITAELRVRELVSLKPADVDGVKITTGGQTLELRRAAEGWQSETNRHARIDAQKVQTYLDELKQLQAERFAFGEEGKAAMNSPAVTVELIPARGEAVKLTVSASGPAGTKDHYATVSGEAGVAVLPAASYGKLSKTLRDFEK